MRTVWSEGEAVGTVWVEGEAMGSGLGLRVILWELVWVWR